MCPSGSQKRSLLLAEHIDEQLLFALPHRQFVFTPLKAAMRVLHRYDQRIFLVGPIGRVERWRGS